ncbi:hypothetical protein GIB67_033843, partial [Kingdonia uniflora]
MIEQHQTILLSRSRSRYSRRLQLIQAYTWGEPNLSFRCKRSNSTSDSRSINLTHTWGELDQNLTAWLLDRPIRPNRTHSIYLKVGYWVNQSNLYSN